MNRQESATNASSIKETAKSLVLPQRDGVQDDYNNDVYNSKPQSVYLRSLKSVTKCDLFFSNFSSQEFQQKTIIPLGNLVSFLIKYGVCTSFLCVADLGNIFDMLAEYRTPTPAVVAPTPRNDTGDDDDDEPPLNEDDDDDDEIDAFNEDNDEPNTQHLVLAQFDKVIVFLI